MDYFKDQLNAILEERISLEYASNKLIPAIYIFARDLRESLSQHFGIDQNLYIHYSRAKDKRSLLVMRFATSDSYLAIKHYKDSKNPLVILKIEGPESLLTLKLTARRLHSFFRELDSYFDTYYNDKQVRYTFSVKHMKGSLIEDIIHYKKEFEPDRQL